MQWLFVKIKYLHYNYKCDPSLPNLKIKCLSAAVACIEQCLNLGEFIDYINY